jgi:hypothetical protein
MTDLKLLWHIFNFNYGNPLHILWSSGWKFNPEDGGNMHLLNVSIHTTDITESE